MTPACELAPGLLHGWKQIAGYMHCDEKTARRHADRGMVVYRDRLSGRVLAAPADLDAWSVRRIVPIRARRLEPRHCGCRHDEAPPTSRRAA